MKILIAEDEPALRENLRTLLELEGFEVMVAFDGQDALETVPRFGPDLVLTDVLMPRLDGFGLVEQLRRLPEYADLPIVMLTARAERADQRAGMRAGADDYLLKPYRRDELLDAIRTRLSRRQSLREGLRLLRQTETAGADSLTDLPRRVAFVERLRLLAQQPGAVMVLCCLGVDRFSQINHTLGAQAGDDVLRELALRLEERARQYEATAFAGRLGGDRFVMAWLLSSVDFVEVGHAAWQEHGLKAVRREVLALQSQLSADACITHQGPVYLTLGLGYVIQPLDGLDPDRLLREAEWALQVAKTRGPNHACHYEPAWEQGGTRAHVLNAALAGALERQEFSLHYQPQVNLQDGSVTGFEALLRWQHPHLGWVSPAEFIPLAEASGQIVKIGAWVLREAATQAARWLEQGLPGVRMAVNVSVRQLEERGLAALLKSILETTGLPPQLIELEITESLALHDLSGCLAQLQACKDLGVKLSMDDFGTGYSSLAYLRHYPVDTLKIDQSFVRNAVFDRADLGVVRAIIAMASSFGLSVIAEGIETREQLALLRSLGCDLGQGYHFSRPQPPAQVVECLRSGFAEWLDAC